MNQKLLQRGNKIYVSDIIKEAIKNKGIENVRTIIYSSGLGNLEYIGMSKFINSRQRWCKRDILRKLKNS
jgi:hypothetical protein